LLETDLPVLGALVVLVWLAALAVVLVLLKR
jgi:hypothetical protein